MINLVKRFLIKFIPHAYAKMRFFKKKMYWPNVSSPKTLNEIVLREIFLSCSSQSLYADKHQVREYISSIKNKHNFEDLKFTKVIKSTTDPKSITGEKFDTDVFVKSSHGSGMCLFIPSEIEIDHFHISQFSKWLETDFAAISLERCYEKIPRKIIIEEALKCKDGSLPVDVKVHCAGGKPFMIQIIRRTSGVLERQTFDASWNIQHWFINSCLNISISPKMKNKVLRYSKELAKDLRYVRVDFYLVDDYLFFSELTLFPAAAAMPLVNKKIDTKLGTVANNLMEG